MLIDVSSPSRSSGPRLLAPEIQRACAPFVLRVVGLPAGAVVRVRAVTRDRNDRPWSAEAVFRSTDTVVDVARDAAVAGSYLGVDPDGLLTTMRPPRAAARRAGRFVPPSASRFLVRVAVRVGTDIVAGATIVRVLVHPDVTVQGLAGGGGTAGRVWRPPRGLLRRPVVLVIAPARSSMAAFAPGLLASRGYPTIDIPLTGRRPGSGGRRHIRVADLHETLRSGLARAGLDNRGAVLFGVAEGAELALHAALDLPDLGGVVAYLPGHRPWLARLRGGRTLPTAGTGRVVPLDRIDARLLVVGADRDALGVAALPDDGMRRTQLGGDRWVRTDGWRPLGPGRLPGDAEGRRALHAGGAAWDHVLGLLRSLSVSGVPVCPETPRSPVISTRPGPPDPDRSAR
jgi:hypothetical protein